MKLRGFGNADKSSKLSLSNPWQRVTGDYLKIIENVNDPICTVKLAYFYRDEHFIPAACDAGVNLKDVAFFYRRAPQRILRV